MSSGKTSFPEPLIRIENLKVTYQTRSRLLGSKASEQRATTAVDSVSLHVYSGSTLGIVGESGSGKSTLAKALCGLLPIESGVITVAGRSRSASTRVVPNNPAELQMIFQDPYSSLDPRMSVGDIVAEPLRAVGGLTRKDRDRRVADVLVQVGLETSHTERYPHEFSGGQRQRISIARALITHPEIVICDEPTSALDVSIQAQILNLLIQLQADSDLTYVFISHDLNVVRHMADDVAVMQSGRVVEFGKATDVLLQPSHPYTQSLLEAAPSVPTTNSL